MPPRPKPGPCCPRAGWAGGEGGPGGGRQARCWEPSPLSSSLVSDRCSRRFRTQAFLLHSRRLHRAVLPARARNWHTAAGPPGPSAHAVVIPHFGREDQLDRQALQRLIRSLARVLPPEDTARVEIEPQGPRPLECRPVGCASWTSGRPLDRQSGGAPTRDYWCMRRRRHAVRLRPPRGRAGWFAPCGCAQSCPEERSGRPPRGTSSQTGWQQTRCRFARLGTQERGTRG